MGWVAGWVELGESVFTKNKNLQTELNYLN